MADHKSANLNAKVSGPGVAAGLAAIAAGTILAAWLGRPAPAVAGILVGLYLIFAIKVVRQWEKVAILRFGRYLGLRADAPCTPLAPPVAEHVVGEELVVGEHVEEVVDILAGLGNVDAYLH